MKIGLASPDQIREWSYGEVLRPETINYRTQKPEKEGLFCERIFGPTEGLGVSLRQVQAHSFQEDKVCEKCGVEVTRAKVRRERMGHIELAAPVSHIWYFKGTPSRIGQMLDISPKRLEEVLYFTKYIVIDPGRGHGTEQESAPGARRNMQISARKVRQDDFKAGMGAEAIKELLQRDRPR